MNSDEKVDGQLGSYVEYKAKVLKKEDRPYAKYLARPISSRISWFILKKWPTVTPNQISVLDFCIGLIGVAILFFAKNSVEILASCLMLLLWSIFDHVDGEVARFKEMKTPTGFFLEITFDYLIVALVPFGISFYLYGLVVQTSVLLIGFIDCLLLVLCELIIANYYWAFYRSSHQSDMDLGVTESQVVNKFGGHSSFVNKFAINMGKFMSRLGSFLTYSGNMLLALIILTAFDIFFKPEITLWGQQVTTLHVFLLSYMLLIPYCISLIVFQYVFLKTRLE